jgi:hypothetical protein
MRRTPRHDEAHGWPADALKGFEAFSSAPARVQIALGGLDLAVTETLHDGLGVGAPGLQPGRVGMAQVVHPDTDVETGTGDGGSPDAGAEGVARHRLTGVALGRWKQQVCRPKATICDALCQQRGEPGADSQHARLVVLGVGLDGVPLPGGGILAGHLDDGLLHPQQPAGQVEVGGSQRGELAPAHPGLDASED